MTEEQTQRYQAWCRYKEALENTRKTRLRRLESDSVTKEESEAIWGDSFTLRYMMDRHKKYIDVLMCLKNGGKGRQAILERLLDGLTYDPTTQLNDLIQEAYRLILGRVDNCSPPPTCRGLSAASRRS